MADVGQLGRTLIARLSAELGRYFTNLEADTDKILRCGSE
jgi:hypothetical protein